MRTLEDQYTDLQHVCDDQAKEIESLKANIITPYCLGCGKEVKPEDDLYMIYGHIYCMICYENSCTVTKHGAV